MLTDNQQAQPGIYGLYTSQPRDIWYSGATFAQFLAPPVILDGNLNANMANVGIPGGSGDYRWFMWAGMPVGRITATNKFRNSIIGLSTATNTNSTTLTASTATVSEVNRLIGLAGGNINLTLVGPPTNTGAVASAAVTASAASGTSITLTGGPGATYVAGSIIMPADGSQTIAGILAEDRGVALVDSLFNRVDAQTDRIAIGGGTINTGLIVNYPTLAVLQTWLKSQITTYCPSLTFLDNQVV